eukprot:15899404-Heterocapsa_arctica.AAC.1
MTEVPRPDASNIELMRILDAQPEVDIVVHACLLATELEQEFRDAEHEANEHLVAHDGGRGFGE